MRRRSRRRGRWEYEPVKVDGKAVRVRVTVPVVFSLALPPLARQAGVPELRQGVAPSWPTGATGGGLGDGGGRDIGAGRPHRG